MDFLTKEKLYYKIGEVSKITGLKPHVLRYWESEFKVIRPYKGKSHQRLYRRSDLEIIMEIKKLLYDEQFTIAGAKKQISKMLYNKKERQMKLRFKDDETKEALKEIKKGLKEIYKLLK
ncbi:MAG: MerR family transcriptional regulator [Deltaproteobacteria bacterium]|nr:MerR family transcriptional regulator [Deltaproteobacteria bacterium]